MKKLTKRQRGEIYLKAAIAEQVRYDTLAEYNDVLFPFQSGRENGKRKLEIYLPELFLFEEVDYTLLTMQSEKVLSLRIIALLFAHQMAKS